MARRWATAMATALAAPGVAAAGGFATVGLSSLPDGLSPGRPWRVELTILQHGRTPLDGLRPRVRIASASGRVTRSFAAAATGRPGVYRVAVVFPAAGDWTYAVDDGFSQSHTFAPVRIGAGSAPAPAAPSPAPPVAHGGSGRDLGAALGAAAIAGLTAAGLTAAGMRRRRRPVGATAPAAR